MLSAYTRILFIGVLYKLWPLHPTIDAVGVLAEAESQTMWVVFIQILLLYYVKHTLKLSDAFLPQNPSQKIIERYIAYILHKLPVSRDQMFYWHTFQLKRFLDTPRQKANLPLCYHNTITTTHEVKNISVAMLWILHRCMHIYIPLAGHINIFMTPVLAIVVFCDVIVFCMLCLLPKILAIIHLI